MRSVEDPFVKYVLPVVIDREKNGGDHLEEIKDATFDRLITQASHNRILYLWVSRLMNPSTQLFALSNKQKQRLDKLLAIGENKLTQLQKTLFFINDTLGEREIPFLVVKTYKPVSYITFDVDLLVTPEEFEATKLALERGGCQIRKHPGESVRKQVNCVKEELLTIDLHQGFFWQGFHYLDQEFVWNSSQYKNIQGVTVPIPRLEVELALAIIHTLYERRYITLLDMLFLRHLDQEGLSLALVNEQAVKYGWYKSGRRFLEIVNSLNQLIHLGEKKGGLFQTENTTDNASSLGSVKWPYFIPWPSVLGFFSEMIRSTGRIPWFDIAYYFFATGRWYLKGKKRLPFYLHWYER